MESTKKPELNREYWTSRWQEGQTGWDMGNVSTPFLSFFDSLQDKKARILIPGCGNGYEGEYLWRSGFRNVYILDISDLPLVNFKSRVPDFPTEQLLCCDFFELDKRFDLVIEQTFFCALDPSWRIKYVRKMTETIVHGGILAGLLFNFPLTTEGPPFGGSREEYERLFTPYFEIIRLEECTTSIKPRQGREFWFEMRRS